MKTRSMLHSLLVCAVTLIWQVAMAATQVTLTPKKNPPDVGDNTFEIKVADDGKPVPNANIKIMLSMPAMGTMPYMEVEGDVANKGGGTYEGTVEAAMGGSWDLTVTVERKGAKDVFRYGITTGIPGIVDKNQKAGSVGTAPAGQAAQQIVLEPDRIQRIGVRFATVKRQEMVRNIRAIGLLEADSSRRSEVSVRYAAYVTKSSGRRVGDHVKAGEVLAKIESPELVAAQQEYLLAHQMQTGAHLDVPAAAERLRNLGMSEDDVRRLQRSKKAVREILLKSPMEGTIVEANAREGGKVEPGQVLFVVGDLRKAFIIARVFQQDLMDIKVGQPVEIMLPGVDGKPRAGRVDLISPQVAEGAGTTNVRIVPQEALPVVRTGNYVEIKIPISLAQRLVVPAESVLFSGQHSYVFLERGAGVLEPTEVITGRRAGDFVEIVSGLSEGQRIVSSGNFMLSSEATLRSALPKWKKPEAAGSSEGQK